MFKHILIPSDGSPLSEKAIKAGIELAKQLGAKVTAFCAIQEYTAIYGDGFPIAMLPLNEQREEEIAWATKNLAVAHSHANSAKVPFEGVHKVVLAPYLGIIDTAKEKDCDLIFMASHGRRGIEGLLLGSETQKVLTHCKIPVLVHR
jgi:nucleotide-binding universal stress UspA family protein